MSTPITGVYPCYENQFQINAAASGVEKKMVDMRTARHSVYLSIME